MRNVLEEYDELVNDILLNGETKGDRTGVGTKSLFGKKITIDISTYAPLVTKKSLPIKSVIGELIWMLQGRTDARYLKDVFKCNFWDDWKSDKSDSIGPMYGYHWRRQIGDTDQLQRLIDEIQKNPYSRRLLLDVWDIDTIPFGVHKPKEFVDLGYQSLAPCHFAIQFNCTDNTKSNGYYVDMQLYQRSCDLLLGGPCNIAFYYMFVYFICAHVSRRTNKQYSPRNLHISYGDVHIYNNQLKEAEVYLKRQNSDFPIFEPDPMKVQLLDLMNINNSKELNRELQLEVFKGFKNYNPQSKIDISRNV